MKRFVGAPGLHPDLSISPPNLLPVLTRGRHRGPEDGACVMEYVSVLAGGRFTDHPQCTHPALASLARLVNDRIADEQIRSGLARLAPDLIGVTGDPRTTHCVIASCLVTAAAGRPQPLPTAQRRLARAHARMRRLERANRWARMRSRWWELLNPPNATVGPAFQLAVEQMRGLTQREKDVRLSKLLHDAVAQCRTLDDGPARTTSRKDPQAT
jgi:hypothetical protein